MDRAVIDLSEAIAEAGGRALLVGGYVRDHVLDRTSKDFDFEVYGLSLAELEATLTKFGEVIAVGRAFGVLRVKGLDMDFSLPRTDNKTGKGHRGFVVDLNPALSFPEAAKRRDLTINSMGLDPLSGEIIDPYGGRDDLKAGILRATDAEQFSEDPLRGLRVAQFAARFAMQPDEELIEICRALDLSELPAERLYGEFEKLLLKGEQPSVGLRFLENTGLLRFFPELDALRGVPQDPQWHPEGDVWIHTCMCLDEAAKLRTGQAFEDEALMFAVLCHDLGKPATTTTDESGRVRAIQHEKVGREPTLRLAEQLKLGHKLRDAVCALVESHLCPSQFIRQGAKAPAYRRLARKLGTAGASLALLERVARADSLGRTTPDALAGRYPAGDAFLARAQDFAVAEQATADIVQGRHLVSRGFKPGPNFRDILDACRAIQDETGGTEADSILDAALAHLKSSG
ncbi:MAG: HD domain-containing protein [Myxococcota bacterium]|nr:HD domain-containing protein [Myxococcota bacterium]